MFEIDGIYIADSPLISDEIRGFLESGMYERPEATILDVHEGDRVLELGVGVGYIASLILKDPNTEAYLGVEANLALLPVIEDTFLLNHVSGTVIHGAIGSDRFYIHKNLWSSSIDGGGDETIVPRIDIDLLVKEFKPTLIVCDIEGAERNLSYLDGVERIIMEQHEPIDLPGYTPDQHGAMTIWERKEQGLQETTN